jgi:ATP-dependent Zn protease
MGEGIFPTQIDSANILDEAIEDTEAFLFKMKDAIKAIEKVLLEKESISKEELKSVVNDFL